MGRNTERIESEKVRIDKGLQRLKGQIVLKLALDGGMKNILKGSKEQKNAKRCEKYCKDYNEG